MSTPFLGEIMAVAFGFAPKGWTQCNGQLLPISQNQAIFSLLGTTYGGNGQTDFALPNLEGRIPISSGQGSGLSNYVLGQVGGEETHTLLQNELPQHTHVQNATSTAGSLITPAGNVLANSPMYVSGPGDSSLLPAVIAATGGSQPHLNLQPFLVINWIIALQGIFPSRN